MIRTIPVKNLLQPWRDNFTNNPSLPFITESSLLGLDLLNEFLTRARQECKDFNGLRIYFIRYDTVTDALKEDNHHIKLVPGTKVSQVSLAIVPVKGFDPVTLAGEDCEEGGSILALSFCDPRVASGPAAAGTGHCPPACNPPRTDSTN